MPRSNAPNILLVEDDELQLELIAHMLQELVLGDMVACKSPREALTKVKQKPGHYHLIVSDWEMPDMSGLELLKQVKKVSPHILFVMVSGNSHKMQIIDAIRAGIDDYVVKPFAAQQLLFKVVKLTGAKIKELR